MEPKGKYQHAEAFCLMTYQCQQCNRREVFWNARDGVTPFIVSCPRCGGEMQHINWNMDQRVLDHIPSKGQGVFVTLPPELRPVIARQRVKSFDGSEFELQGAEREEMIVNLAADMHEDEPFLFFWR